MLERRSSVEREPQTLGPNQLKCAREAALYVLHSKTFEEAIHIFTEGLEPVSITGISTDDDDDDCELDWLEEDDWNAHLLEEAMMDRATAPF